MTSILIIGISLYMLGAFLTALAIGFFRPNMDEELAELIFYFWPLTLIVIGAMRFGDAIEDWANRNPSTSHRICSIIDRITIPFRPISLGRKIREWRDSRKGAVE